VAAFGSSHRIPKVAAARHPHANYVLQKLIVTMQPGKLQFVLDELAPKNRVYQAARHKYGCRVLQRLFEHCRPDQMHPIVEVLLANARELSRDPFANFVVQHLFEFSPFSYHRVAIETLASNLQTFGRNHHVSAVLTAALIHSSEENQVFLARALIANRVLLLLAGTRKGSMAVKAALDVLDGSERDVACKQLVGDPSALRSRYGRSVVRAIGECNVE